MAENKKSIIVYADWINKFEELSDDEAGRLIKHFFRYVNDKNPIAPDRTTKLMFIDIEASLKRDLVKWEKTIEGRSYAGKASAEARRLAKENEQNSTKSTNVKNVQQKSTKLTDSVSVNDSDSVILLKKETKHIPEWIEFLTYGLEKKPTICHSSLKLKYEAWKVNDWKNGNGKPIKNWKSTLLNTIPYIKTNEPTINGQPVKQSPI